MAKLNTKQPTQKKTSSVKSVNRATTKRYRHPDHERVQFTYALDSWIFDGLKNKAAEQKKSLSILLEDLLIEALEEHGKTRPIHKDFTDGEYRRKKKRRL